MAQAIDDARNVPNGDNKNPPWYHPKPKVFDPDLRELFENYSRIPAADVDNHVIGVRDKAWAVYKYPCIGIFTFLNTPISNHPAYPRILALLQASDYARTLLDIGCCFAQDIRRLIYDGVPSERLYGTDLNSDFMKLGYELFADKETCAAHFFAADVFQDGEEWDGVRGKMDFIYLGSFLHIFSWDDQLKICKRVIELLKPQKGSIVFGRQSANLKAREVENVASGDKHAPMIWRHDAESFKKLWHAAGQETDTKWNTWAELITVEEAKASNWVEPDLRGLLFKVERME